MCCGWLPDKLSLTPSIATDLCDERGVRKRMRGEDHNRFLSIVAKLTAAYSLSDNFALTASLGQFGNVNHTGRRTTYAPNKRDLTFASVGFAVEF